MNFKFSSSFKLINKLLIISNSTSLTLQFKFCMSEYLMISFGLKFSFLIKSNKLLIIVLSYFKLSSKDGIIILYIKSILAIVTLI